MSIEPCLCKCGGMPEIYTAKTVSTGRYQGFVECKNCGDQVWGVYHVYDREEAVEDAVEEWNKVMEHNDD